jgi:hypothetical protein
MDKENPTYAGLIHESGFVSAKLITLPWLVKGSAAMCTCKKEYSKYNLTATQCF